jgi:hypothetical protein
MLPGMTREIIAQALESEGLKSGAHGFAIPEDRETACLISAPGDVYTVSRIVVFDLRDKYVFLQTSKDDRFFFAYEDVLGVRILGRSQSKERSATGFSR